MLFRLSPEIHPFWRGYAFLKHVTKGSHRLKKTESCGEKNSQTGGEGGGESIKFYKTLLFFSKPFFSLNNHKFTTYIHSYNICRKNHNISALLQRKSQHMHTLVEEKKQDFIKVVRGSGYHLKIFSKNSVFLNVGFSNSLMEKKNLILEMA